MSPNGSLLAATTSGRPSFSYVRFPGQARAEDKEWLDKEGLCGGWWRAGTEGEGRRNPPGVVDKETKLWRVSVARRVLAVLGKTLSDWPNHNTRVQVPYLRGTLRRAFIRAPAWRCPLEAEGKEGFNFSLLSGEPTQVVVGG